MSRWKPLRQAALALSLVAPAPALASSHMDAALITLDDAANTTDVYAFVSSRSNSKYLTTALAVYPFEEPGIGPNKYNFDDNVLYEIHVSLGDDVAKGRATISYQFRFKTTYKSVNTILQSYLGVIDKVGDAGQNLVQTYTVSKYDRRSGKVTPLGKGIVPPNNQGRATPRYNQGDNGDNIAKDGVATEDALDAYTAQSLADLRQGYRAFAGQRDDGFYADVLATFDLLQLRPNAAKDSQGGFNVHTISLEIPVDDLGGDMQTAGVHATTSRQRVTILSERDDPLTFGDFVQVGRQGNPLFCEVFVAIKDKDRYNRTSPNVDGAVFAKYALNPELAVLANKILLGDLEGDGPIQTMNRTDLAGIFIPDVIKVDLSTPPARLAGGGPGHPTNPDDTGFSRLSVFGGDTLISALTGKAVAGGWPNGRRFGDDVFDIGVSAVANLGQVVGDGVNQNDIAYNKVFPYAATPLNGRNHTHP